MTFQWPGFLALLALIPVLIGIYIYMLRRRRRFAVRYSSLSLVRAARPQQSWLRRHLPFALFVAAIGSLAFALARPVSIVAVPTGQTTVVLAIDVSRSMCSTDVSPSRLEAAQAAALSFIQRQKSTTQIGIVAFSGFAEMVQAPTTDSEELQSAIQSLQLGNRTAIGSGLLKSIDTISEIDSSVAPSTFDPSAEPAPVPQGAYAPDIVVLLTDGVSNTGPEPLDAAQQAATRGVRVYTIGFGTANGGEFPPCLQQLIGREPNGGPNGGFQRGGGGGGRGFGGGGGGGPAGFRRGIDEATLKQVADLTGGEYYAASSASELNDVFQNLPTYLIMKHETSEIAFIFTAIGALLAAVAVVLSILWRPTP